MVAVVLSLLYPDWCPPSVLSPAGWQHAFLQWARQLFQVHNGDGEAVHEGRGGARSPPVLTAQAPGEGSQGENQG